MSQLSADTGGGGSGGAAGGLKFTVADTCERIKEEFNFIQQQYHSLKLECEKLASEKTEMQRHYVMSRAVQTENNSDNNLVP
ncbi:Protein groucho [Temnothorax longispinosus]|uniref:Protein groucho n=1 Tax=Temnothorax longispinosus TaxID=300112 RepID=A0A4S2JUD9_9HYME|nr:Protein groucho [Temnothorax longispinosus]